ncbi:unnamed protein product [Trichobilharzia szidati]|nr:unnamed protein product [Trichobilharzia szidati]
MRHLVSVTLLLLYCLLGCSDTHRSTSNARDDFKSALMEYKGAYDASQLMQYHILENSAISNDAYNFALLLTESQRLDNLYRLKWINELISSPVFQANKVTDEDTKRRYANEYEEGKRLNKSTSLREEDIKILIETFEEKWKARARLDAAEDAQLSRSSATCSKKEVYGPEEYYMTESVRQIQELKKNAKNILHGLFQTFKQLVWNNKETLYASLERKIKFAEEAYRSELDALAETVVDVEYKRLHYLKYKHRLPAMDQHTGRTYLQ